MDPRPGAPCLCQTLITIRCSCQNPDISGVNSSYSSSEPLFSAISQLLNTLRSEPAQWPQVVVPPQPALVPRQGWEQPCRTVLLGPLAPRIPSKQAGMWAGMQARMQAEMQAGMRAGMQTASPAPISHLGLNISSAAWEKPWHEQGINTGLTIAAGPGRSWTPAARASIAKINTLQAKVRMPVNIKSMSCIMHSNAGVREGDNMIHLPDSSF